MGTNCICDWQAKRLHISKRTSPLARCCRSDLTKDCLWCRIHKRLLTAAQRFADWRAVRHISCVDVRWSAGPPRLLRRVCGPGASCPVSVIDSRPVASVKTPDGLSHHTSAFSYTMPNACLYCSLALLTVATVHSIHIHSITRLDFFFWYILWDVCMCAAVLNSSFYMQQMWLPVSLCLCLCVSVYVCAQ